MGRAEFKFKHGGFIEDPWNIDMTTLVHPADSDAHKLYNNALQHMKNCVGLQYREEGFLSILRRR